MYILMPEISAQNDMYKINSKHCSTRKQSLVTGLTADLGPPIDRLAVNHPPQFYDNRQIFGLNTSAGTMGAFTAVAASSPFNAPTTASATSTATPS
jgi:hypothetical protein